MRHRFRTLLITVLVITGIWRIATPAVAPAATSATISAHFFGNLTGSSTTTPGPADALFTGFANRATTSIDVALYELNRASIRDALLAAKARGVTVRVVGDNDLAADPVDGAFYSALQTAGIPLVTDTPRTSLMHNKFAVFDSQVTWTGSANFSNTAFTRNGENVVVITDTVVATSYQTEFNEMFGGTFSTAKTDNTVHTTLVGGSSVELAFSPSDSIQQRIVDALNTANTSIQVAMFTFTNTPIAQALMAAKQRGVAVEVVLDQVAAGSSFSQRDPLCAAGVTVRVEDWNGTLHNKYAVIDAGTTSDPQIITGSTNWTSNGVNANDENLLIVHDADIATAFAQDVARLKAPISAGAFVCNSSLQPTSAAYLPIVLSGLTSVPSATPTVTPTLPPPSFTSCSAQPNAATAPHYPVAIVTVFKSANPEIVRLQNVSANPVDLTGWTMCSITGGQTHTGIGGTLAPGEVKDFAYTGGTFIWNNSASDPGALYTPDGRLASYWPAP